MSEISTREQFNRYYPFNEGEVTQIREWWAALQTAKGERAKLRRAKSPIDVTINRSFISLLRKLGNQRGEELPTAAVAGLLSHVRDDDPGRLFFAALGTPRTGTDAQMLSELRFEQIQHTRSLNELYLRFRRAIALLNGVADVASVAAAVFQWFSEHVSSFERRFAIDRRLPCERFLAAPNRLDSDSQVDTK